MTNFECIKSMSVEQLAQFLDDTQRRECEGMHVVNDDGTLRHQSLVTGWTNWLMKEAKIYDEGGQHNFKSCCASCQYGKPDDLGDRICTNVDSENCADWVDDDDACECWEGKS